MIQEKSLESELISSAWTASAIREKVYDFWFNRFTSIDQQNRFAFCPTQQEDNEVISEFKNIIEVLKQDSVLREELALTDHGAIAIIILFDQMVRNIFRGSPNLFDWDHLPLAIAIKLLEKHQEKLYSQFTDIEMLYLGACLAHSENLKNQECACVIAHYLNEKNINGPAESSFKKNFTMINLHKEEIRRFGRFPHRNNLLGRISRPEEEMYLGEIERPYQISPYRSPGTVVEK